MSISIESVSYSYGKITALNSVSFSVEKAEIFGLVGPNGGGKSTLFKILSTLLLPQAGNIRILDFKLPEKASEVRQKIGVVFQSAALDRKLTVEENLVYQSYLYGLRGRTHEIKMNGLLEQVGLLSRKKEIVSSLSGGLQRRVEIIKAMLHDPSILILDEPSTGLDPLIRKDFWEFLLLLRNEKKVTILLTTHLLDEADRCDRIALLDRGSLVALGNPEELKEELGGDIISIRSRKPEKLKNEIQSKFNVSVSRMDGSLRIETNANESLVADIVSSFHDDVDSVTLGKPTLEDLFIKKTGHQYMESR